MLWEWKWKDCNDTSIIIYVHKTFEDEINDWKSHIEIDDWGLDRVNLLKEDVSL
jgi:hypothetical protein